MPIAPLRMNSLWSGQGNRSAIFSHVTEPTRAEKGLYVVTTAFFHYTWMVASEERGQSLLLYQAP